MEIKTGKGIKYSLIDKGEVDPATEEVSTHYQLKFMNPEKNVGYGVHLWVDMPTYLSEYEFYEEEIELLYKHSSYYINRRR